MHELLRRVMLLSFCLLATSVLAEGDERHFLYVATPGIRNYLEYGGHGLLVFDINNDHKFVRRIPTGGIKRDGTPINVKGMCASAETGRIYISTIEQLLCYNLNTDRLLWERRYVGGCDRMSISPDGKVIYQPSFEKGHWHVLDAMSGDVLARIQPNSRAHNTVYGPDGTRCYLAGLSSPLLTVADTTNHKAIATVGPFSHNIRPFTVNGSQTLVFVCINECLGFEIGDLKTGKKIHRVEVKGFEQGKVKRHGCPSHGIGMTPDESEIWVCDAYNKRMHIFDATQMPPKQITSLKCRGEPGWISFSIDGKFAYPSSGDVFDVQTRKRVAQLTDEKGRAVGSEKLLEVVFKNGRVVATGNQFGVGGVKK